MLPSSQFDWQLSWYVRSKLCKPFVKRFVKHCHSYYFLFEHDDLRKSGKVWREIFTAVGHIGIFYFKKICCLLESQFTIEHTCLSCIGGSSLSFWNCLILVSSTSACWIKKEYAISIMDKLSVWYELAVWNRWFACSRWMTNYVPKFIFGWFIYQHILKTCRHTNQLFPIALFMFHLKSPPGSHVHVISMH